jgi:hypothetical protein
VRVRSPLSVVLRSAPSAKVASTRHEAVRDIEQRQEGQDTENPMTPRTSGTRSGAVGVHRADAARARARRGIGASGATARAAATDLSRGGPVAGQYCNTLLTNQCMLLLGWPCAVLDLHSGKRGALFLLFGLDPVPRYGV